MISFDRYYFAQQDKLGAVIDERYNGGGYLDDYMVDLMTRRLRAAVTNEVPNGKPFNLPAGILGPKVLLINGSFIAENEGIPPDIEVRMDTRSTVSGGDPQLERGVSEALRLLEQQPPVEVTVPAYPRPTRKTP